MWSPDALAKRSHDLGAPLRNRTVDLLLTMNHRRVQLSQVGQLTRQNMSAHQRSPAPDRPSRAQFATRSATQFDLRRIVRLLRLATATPGPANTKLPVPGQVA
jgi:hypothetical protein